MIYLIDGENIPWNKLVLDNLRNGDSVYYFYSPRIPSPSNKVLERLLDKGIHLRVIKCFTGVKNAMDMQMAAYAGRLASDTINQDIVFLTNDKGFEVIVKFLSTHDNTNTFKRVENHAPNSSNQNQSMQLESKEIEIKESSLPSNYGSEEVEVISEAFRKSSNKLELYLFMRMTLGHKRGSELYREVKLDLNRLNSFYGTAL